MVSGGSKLVIDRQAPKIGEPGEGAFDNPALGHGHKAAHTRRPTGQFVPQAQRLQVGGKAAPAAIVW